MAALKTLIGWLALLFHLLFCLSSVVLGAFAMATDSQSLRLGMLPWTGAALARILLFGGVLGLLATVLAALGKLRFLFLFWSLAVAIVLLNHLFTGGYRFAPGEWRLHVYLVLTAWLAVLGAFFLMFSRPTRGPRKYWVK